MKRLICALIALLLALIPGAWAEQTDVPAALIDLVAAHCEQLEPFEGAPDAGTAWALMAGALAREPDAEVACLTQAQAQDLYAALFEQGTLPQPPQGSEASAAQDGYEIRLARGEAVCRATLNGVREMPDGAREADVSVIAQLPDGSSEFLLNMYVRYRPDEGQILRARLTGLAFETCFPVFERAEATAQLSGEAASFEAGNVLDADAASCWSYNEGRDPHSCIALYCDAPQQVRALSLQPQDARNAEAALGNNRVKTLRITLSDGYTVTAEIPELSSCEAWHTLAFEGVHTVDWVELQVLEVYPGQQYDDTCISAVMLH